MKQQTLTILLTVLMSMVGIRVWAYDFEVNGIYYYVTGSGTAKVTSGSNKYTGSVVIPSTVTYTYRDGYDETGNAIYVTKTYRVTSIDGVAFKNCSSLT